MTIATESYRVAGRILFRHVTPKIGRQYLHTCSEPIFKAVLQAIDDENGRAFCGRDLVRATDAPHTQVYTALAFLKERGCIITAHGRKSVAPTIFDVTLDAMIEFEVLHDTGDWI